jgi:polysaccharide export outer membrane protein
VFVKEYRSQPVYVLGAVKSPGQYLITGQMRIVDAISMAGGVQSPADDEVTIQRPLADGGETSIPVNLSKILETGDLQENVYVQGGDVINVKQHPVETVYVIGEVNRAGAYTKAPKQPVRVSQLIALAGGPMKTAKSSKGILVRYNEAGQRSEMPLDVQAIITGKSPDMFVQANDVIFIPGSTMKSLGYGIMQVVPGTVAAIPWVF